MISVAYALLVVSLAFGNGFEAWAAPVGTRSVHVQSMRRMPFEKEHMRRAHHSATSVVQRDNVPVAVVAREPEPAPIVDPVFPQELVLGQTPNLDSTPIVANTGSDLRTSASGSASLETGSIPVSLDIPLITKSSVRRHDVKNEARGTPVVRRALPRFKRDEAGRRSVGDKLKERKSDVSDENVAREPREPQPTPVRPVAMFRRALAFENLD
ncbi:hypothetical protein C0995_015761 [Termitomyces sp. Mi166|nr:hypothetical protein C0995_015761 [Termitomyces sp. Mi166\